MVKWQTLVVAGIVTTAVVLFQARRYVGLPDGACADEFWAASLGKMIDLTRQELENPSVSMESSKLSDLTSRIVVIPDVHGDLENFSLSIWLGLKEVDGVDITFTAFKGILFKAAFESKFPDRTLSTADTLFVQMGDIVDRGPSSVACLRVLWVVERVVGWKVVSLYGNHELMSAFGNHQDYIHPADMGGFGTITDRYRAFRSGSPLGDMIQRKSVGMARIASSPQSTKGVLFVHAGVEISYMEDNINFTMREVDSIAEFNTRLSQAISSNSKTELERLALSGDSILWTRLLARLAEDPDSCDRLLSQLLIGLEVDRIVVGHTPQSDHRMKSLCGSRVILTDLALSRWMYGDSGQPGLLMFESSRNGNDWAAIEAVYYDVLSQAVSRESLQESVVPRFEVIESANNIRFNLLKGLFKRPGGQIGIEVELGNKRKGVVDMRKAGSGCSINETLESIGIISDYGRMYLFGEEYTFSLIEVGHIGSLNVARKFSRLNLKAIDDQVKSLEKFGIIFNDGAPVVARDSLTGQVHLVSFAGADDSYCIVDRIDALG